MGYHRAGFDVYGVDIAPQPNYPFPFRQGDAIETLRDHWHEFDAYHFSPPCQSHSSLTSGTNRYLNNEYPDLIALTRLAARITRGRPWVIENVQGAPIRSDITLCGEMFGLEVIRHRLFECHGFTPIRPVHKPHRGRVAGMRHGEWFTGPYFQVYGDGGGKGSVAEWQRAMGITWTGVRKEIAEAIPPAYTEYIGGLVMTAIMERAA